MRTLNKAVAGIATIVLAVVFVGCSSKPSLQASSAVGKTLSVVTASAPEDTQFLIQDSSPRVGKPASFSLSVSDQTSWTVVAICADNEVLADAGIIEISIIPKQSYTAATKNEVADGKFADAVTCDDLSYR